METALDLLKIRIEGHKTPDSKQAKKNVTQEFQDYGIRLAYRLGDDKHKPLYIRYAKVVPRALLEDAAAFASDYPKAQNKGKIFMWKLHELIAEYIVDHPDFKHEMKKLKSRKKKVPTEKKTKPKKVKKENKNADQLLII